MIRAERKAGGLLADMDLNAGSRGAGKKVELQPATPLSLESMGIEKTQSHRWQSMARLPDERFDEYIATQIDLA